MGLMQQKSVSCRQALPGCGRTLKNCPPSSFPGRRTGATATVFTLKDRLLSMREQRGGEHASRSMLYREMELRDADARLFSAGRVSGIIVAITTSPSPATPANP